MNASPAHSSRTAAALIAVALFAAYANSLGGPFVYDDIPAIADNASLHHFVTALFPPTGTTTSGRPLVNLSLALNFAISGSDVWSYHTFNIVIHLAASLTLFGLVRRTLSIRQVGHPTAVACGAALLWSVHPLQTEAVTYVVQRAESLMGLFYLLTLYSFVRAVGSSAPRVWFALSFIACLAGMACKEVMVSAPLMVLLYDRTFVGGSFRTAWQKRKSFYVSLTGPWLLLAVLVASTGGNRSGTVGFDVGVPWWAYWVTQFRAVTHYLALAFWPQPLIFEYGTFWETSFAEVAPRALILLTLLTATIVALWRRSAFGFLGAWFFVMLAPTSVLPGTTQMIVEHRMYLSLAAVLVFVVVAANAWFGTRSLIVILSVAVILAGVTGARNADYRSELALWGDTVTQCPTSALAHCNFAVALVKQQRLLEAVTHYEQALALAPHAPNTHYNYALALAKLNRVPDAIAHYEQALSVQPDFASAQCNLGTLLFETGRVAEAVPHFKLALHLTPTDAETHCNLANALFQSGRATEALQHYERALALAPDNAENHYNFANTLLQLGRTADAIAHYEQSLALRPDDPDAHCNLGVAYEQAGRPDRAIAHWRTALRLRPDYAAVRAHLARLHAI